MDQILLPPQDPAVLQAPVLAHQIQWLKEVADQWQTITKAPREWVMPREIGIAIPNGWATTSLQNLPELGFCPLTGIISTRPSTLMEPQGTEPKPLTADTLPPGPTLTLTDSTATFPPETGKDSLTTIPEYDQSDSNSSCSTSRSRKSQYKIRPKRSPTISPAPYRSLRTRSTSSRTY
ncbi:assembly activating protein [Bearded dragon parvovirus]|uniref:Assembly activating protein n=1 Tax=Bearded dragon parvovirus TaxID=1670662 RepID=A0A0G3ZAR2_9VIRU|nr:assembly activating protein [Bearded dragon parvovirus]AKM49965.1 assembly activating protein [Bearded dragon parvovirus]